MVEAAERSGVLTRDSILVESSSGNLGVALSMIAAGKGYRFLCVTDSHCNLTTRQVMEALGSDVHVVSDEAGSGSLLGARLALVRALCASDDRCVWLSQYTNANNWKAHYRRTGPAIARAFPQIDTLFVGVGTTGTLMGCARFFRAWNPSVRIVAVDSAGSAIFGGTPGRRMIPGLGMSMRPPLLDEAYVDEAVSVEEADTVRTCRMLARRGFLFGGSTGTVVSGATGWLARHGTRGPPPSRSPRTSASATSTRSTSPTGHRRSTATTSSCREDVTSGAATGHGAAAWAGSRWSGRRTRRSRGDRPCASPAGACRCRRSAAGS